LASDKVAIVTGCEASDGQPSRPGPRRRQVAYCSRSSTSCASSKRVTATAAFPSHPDRSQERSGDELVRQTSSLRDLDILVCNHVTQIKGLEDLTDRIGAHVRHNFFGAMRVAAPRYAMVKRSKVCGDRVGGSIYKPSRGGRASHYTAAKAAVSTCSSCRSGTGPTTSSSTRVAGYGISPTVIDSGNASGEEGRTSQSIHRLASEIGYLPASTTGSTENSPGSSRSGVGRNTT